MQLRVFRFYMAHASTARREWAASHVMHNIYIIMWKNFSLMAQKSTINVS